MNNEPVVIEHYFNVPIAKVWSAITSKNEMKHWCFDLADFRPVVGFEFTFIGRKSDGQPKVHLCKVTEVIKDSKITYSWAYQDCDGISHVTWELFDEKGKTRLRLTHTGLENFSVTPNNDFAKGNFVNGWIHIIGTSLSNYLQQA